MQQQKISVWQLTSITIVNMMGSGTILLPANLATVGNLSIMAWAITTCGALMLAFGFARAGSYSERNDGMGGYAEYVFGRAGAFLADYTYAISELISDVALAVSCTGYFAGFMGWKLDSLGMALVTTAVLWLASFLNIIDERLTMHISTLAALGVILPLLFLVTFGWHWFRPSIYMGSWNPHHYSLITGMNKSVAITLWAFLGMESASANMGKVENPRKNVPIAVTLGTGIVAVFYVMSSVVVQGIIPASTLAKTNSPFGLVFAELFNPLVGRFVMVIMVLACFGSLVTWQFTLAEVFRSSADKGYFPKIFAFVNRRNVAVYGLLILTAVQSVLAIETASPSLEKQYLEIVNISVFTNCIPYLLSMASLDVMQRRARITNKRTRRVNIVVSIFTQLYTIYTIPQCGMTTIFWGMVVLFGGWLIYGLISYNFDLEHDIRP